MRLASIFGMMLALQLALAPAHVGAQEELPRAQQARYRELIGKALQEYQLGHWPEARVFFADAHSGLHPHFTCTDCGSVSCLPEDVVRINKSGRLPRALREQAVEVSLRGVCDRCS